MIRYGIILLVICFCASLVLSLTYRATHARIEAQTVTEEKGSLNLVFPGATSFEEKNIGAARSYTARKDGRDVGYVLRVEAQGYASTIVMLVGFDATGAIKGITILSQEETPGLGSKITELRHGEDRPWFLRQFEGRRAQSLSMQDIAAVTGATISSTAVLEGVKKAITEFLATVQQ